MYESTPLQEIVELERHASNSASTSVFIAKMQFQFPLRNIRAGIIFRMLRVPITSMSQSAKVWSLVCIRFA